MSLARPYQNKTIEACRKSFSNGHKKILLCSPGGSGKTFMFCRMVENHINKGGKAIIITDRIELLRQSGKAFKNIQEIKAGHEPDLTKSMHVAMIETLYRRLDRYKNYLNTRTMIILDEAHKQAFNKLFPYINENQYVIGASATPIRTGKQEPLDAFYTDMIQVIDTPELIELGFLSSARTYGVDIDLKGIKKKGDDYDTDDMARRYSENKVYEGVIQNYNRICPNTKAILFASNRASSKEMCMQFNLAGIPAKHLDSDKKLISSKQRDEIMQWFKDTKNGVLCNVGIATTGLDVPDIKTVILYRSTLSLSLYIQMVVRASRIVPGKKDFFYFLDFGNNVQQHGFYEQPREWSLSKKPKRKKEGPAPVKICPSCHAMLPTSANGCTFCNYEFKKEYSGKNEFAELKLLSPPEIWKVAKGKTLEEKAAMAKEKLIKPMRVLHEIETKEEGLAFIKAMGYKPSFAYLNRQRFKCFESL